MNGTIEDLFVKGTQNWKEHCEKFKFSSDPRVYIQCEGYESITQLGVSVLPLIYNHYNGDNEEAFFPIFGWAMAISTITKGDFVILPELEGRVHEIRDYAISWLDVNMKKYL